MRSKQISPLVTSVIIAWAGCSQNKTIPSSKEVPASEPAASGKYIRGWNFDQDKLGELPPGWKRAETHPTQAVVNWQVIGDPSAPSPQNVFALTRTQNTGSTYNMAIAEEVSVADVDLTVKVKANSGDEDQGGGLIWRYQDQNNYYVCRINPLEGNYRVYKVVNGKRTQLGSADVEAEWGKWYTLRAVMTGDRIACYLNDRKLLEAADDTIKDAGAIGFWTKADAGTSFDDLILAEP